MAKLAEESRRPIQRKDCNVSVDVEPWCKATLIRGAERSAPPQTLTTLVRTIFTRCAEFGLVIRNVPVAEFSPNDDEANVF
jgi:hypothetical protein